MVFLPLTALLAVLASSNAAMNFEEYVKNFSKNWKEGEYARREIIFNSAVAKIEAHNKLYEAGTVSFKKGINKMTDMDPKEYKSLLGYDKKMQQVDSRLGATLDAAGIKMKSLSELPESVDWREAGIVSAVKDQGHCGSCWAFSTTAVLESHVAKNSGLLFDLSTQQLASCAPNPEQCGGTGGCEGATYDVSFGYVSDITSQGSGLFQEYQYAYNSYYGEDFTCKDVPEPVAGISGYATLQSNNYTQLMNAVAQLGPVAVVVDASDWSTYSEGVFDGCNAESPDINHGVVVVGYGVCETHGPYWLVRNSWSPAWGQQGYIRLRRADSDDLNCGVDTTPQDGTACVGDDTPQKVCGSCGVLFNSVLPIGARAFAVEEGGRKP